MTNILEQPETPVIPASEPEKKSGKRVTCDFCKCSLSPEGDVLKMSDTAKELRDASDTIERLKRDVASVKAELEAEKARTVPAPETPATEAPATSTRKLFGRKG